MYHFSKEQVLDHYLERAQAEVDFIQEHAAELVGQFDLMPETRDRMRAYGDSFDGRFFLSSLSPTPLLSLVCSLQLEINENPRDMKSPASILGGFVLPALSTTTSDQIIDGRQSQSQDFSVGCTRTEQRFVGAMQQVRTRSYNLQERISVSVDEEGSPVLFRKGNSETTALTLCNLRVGDCLFPAGTIVDVRGNDHAIQPKHTQESELDGHHERLDVFELPDDFRVAPIRLSAWAFDDPLDRAIFGIFGNFDKVGTTLRLNKTTSFNAGPPNMTSRYTIGGFREAANQVLVLCGADLPAPV